MTTRTIQEYKTKCKEWIQRVDSTELIYQCLIRMNREIDWYVCEKYKGPWCHYVELSEAMIHWQEIFTLCEELNKQGTF